MAKKSGARAEGSDAPLRRHEKARLAKIKKLVAAYMKDGMTKKAATSAANKATRKINTTR